jgi:hypothetical protein
VSPLIRWLLGDGQCPSLQTWNGWHGWRDTSMVRLIHIFERDEDTCTETQQLWLWPWLRCNAQRGACEEVPS